MDGDTRDGNTDNREEILPSTATLVPSPGPILCWIISWNFPDSKNPAEVLDNRIKEEMEEEIVCKLYLLPSYRLSIPSLPLTSKFFSILTIKIR